MKHPKELYRPELKINGDALRLEAAFPSSKHSFEWVCWRCEESVIAESEGFLRQIVDVFWADHLNCDHVHDPDW